MALQTTGTRLVLENLAGYVSGMQSASSVTDTFADRLNSLGRNRVELNSDSVSGYSSSIAQATEKTGIFGTQLSATQVIGIGALAAIGAEAVKLTAKLIELGAKAVIDFAVKGFEGAETAQQTLADIQATSGATDQQVEQLNQKLREVSLRPDLKVGFDEAGQAVQQLLNLGIKLPAILGGGLEEVVTLQNSIGGSLADNGQLFAQAVRQFKIPPEQFGNLTNAITALRRSGLDIQDIQGLLSQGGGAAGAITGFEDFFKAAALARPGFGSGSDLGTSFKTLESRIANPPKELREALKEYGLNFFDAATGQFVGFEKVQQEVARVLSGPVTFSQVSGGRTADQEKEFRRLSSELARKQRELQDVNTGVKSFLSDDAKNKRIHVLEDEIRHTQELLGPLQAVQGSVSHVSRQLTEKEKLNLAQALGGSDALRLILQLGGATQQEVEDLNKLFATTSAADSAAQRTATFQAKIETLQDVLGQLGRDAATPLLAPLTPAIEDLTRLANAAAPGIQTLGKNVAEYIGPAIAFFTRLTDAILGLSGNEGIILGIGKAVSEAFNFQPATSLFDFLFPPDVSSKATGAIDGLKKQVESGITDLGAGKGILLNLIPKASTDKLNLSQGVAPELDPKSFEGQLDTFFGNLKIDLQRGLDGISLTKLTLGDFLAFDPAGVSFLNLGEGVKATLKDGVVTVQLGAFTFDLTSPKQAIQTEIDTFKQAFSDNGIPGVFSVLKSQVTQGIADLKLILIGGNKSQGKDEPPVFEPGLLTSALSSLESAFPSVGTVLHAIADEVTTFGTALTGIPTQITGEFDLIIQAFQTNGFAGVGALLTSQFGSVVDSVETFISEKIKSLTTLLFGGTKSQSRDETPVFEPGVFQTLFPKVDLTQEAANLTSQLDSIVRVISSFSLSSSVTIVTTEIDAFKQAFTTGGLEGVGFLAAKQISDVFTSIKDALFGSTKKTQGRDEAPTTTPGLLSDLVPDFSGLTDKLKGQLDSLKETLFGSISPTGEKTPGLLPSFELPDIAKSGIASVQGLFDDVATAFSALQTIDTGSVAGNFSLAITTVLDLFTKLNNLETQNLSGIVGQLSSFVQSILNFGASQIGPTGPINPDVSAVGTATDDFIASFINRITSVLEAADVPGVATAATTFVTNLISTLAESLTVPLDENGSQTVDSGKTSKTAEAAGRLIVTLFDEIEKVITSPDLGKGLGRAGGSIGNLIVSDLLAPLADSLDPKKLQDQVGQPGGIGENPFTKLADNFIAGFSESFDKVSFQPIADKFADRLVEAILAVAAKFDPTRIFGGGVTGLLQNGDQTTKSDLRQGTESFFSDPFLLWRKLLGGESTQPTDSTALKGADTAADRYATSANTAGNANTDLAGKIQGAGKAVDGFASTLNALAGAGPLGPLPGTSTAPTAPNTITNNTFNTTTAGGGSGGFGGPIDFKVPEIPLVLSPDAAAALKTPVNLQPPAAITPPEAFPTGFSLLDTEPAIAAADAQTKVAEAANNTSAPLGTLPSGLRDLLSGIKDNVTALGVLKQAAGNASSDLGDFDGGLINAIAGLGAFVDVLAGFTPAASGTTPASKGTIPPGNQVSNSSVSNSSTTNITNPTTVVQSASVDTPDIAEKVGRVGDAVNQFTNLLDGVTTAPVSKSTTINNITETTNNNSSITDVPFQTPITDIPKVPSATVDTTDLVRNLDNLISPLNDFSSGLKTDTGDLSRYGSSLESGRSALSDLANQVDLTTDSLGAFADVLAGFIPSSTASAPASTTPASLPTTQSTVPTNRSVLTPAATREDRSQPNLSQFNNQLRSLSPTVNVNVNVPQTTGVPQRESRESALNQIASNTDALVQASQSSISQTSTPVVASGENPSATVFDPQTTGEAVASATEAALHRSPLNVQIDESGLTIDTSHLSLIQPDWKKIITLQPDWRAILKVQPDWQNIIKNQPSWPEIITKQPSWAEIITKQPEWQSIINGDIPWTSLITPVDLSEFVTGGTKPGGSTGGGGGGGGGGRAFRFTPTSSPNILSQASAIVGASRPTTNNYISQILGQPPTTFNTSNTSYYSSTTHQPKVFNVSYTTAQSTGSFARDVRILETLSS